MAEFYSDLDSKEQDEAKALEIKAKDFWQSLMDSAEGLQASENALLAEKVDKAVESLPPEDNDIRELFNTAMGHLAKADSMLLGEALSSKRLAMQRLQNGPAREAFFDFTSEWQDAFYSAITRFIGYKSYEKRLAKHITSRLREVMPTIHQAADMAPQMLDESSKASDHAYKILHSRISGRRDLSLDLQKLASEIVRATGQQRLRFTNYLLNSFMTTAQDLASKNEKASKTVVQAGLRNLDGEISASETTPPSERKNQPILLGEPDRSESKPRLMRREDSSASTADEEAPLMFVDGVPVDSEPIAHFSPGLGKAVSV